MGQIEQQIIKQSIREGKPIPDRIQNAPILPNYLIMYLQAFYELDTERIHQYIPFSSILRYAKFYEFDREQTENLIYYIRQIEKEIEKKKLKGT